MRVTVKTRVTMTVILDQFKGEDKPLSQIKAEMALTIQDHLNKRLLHDREDDVNVKAVVDEVLVTSATHEG